MTIDCKFTITKNVPLTCQFNKAKLIETLPPFCRPKSIFSFLSHNWYLFTEICNYITSVSIFCKQQLNT